MKAKTIAPESPQRDVGSSNNRPSKHDFHGIYKRLSHAITLPMASTMLRSGSSSPSESSVRPMDLNRRVASGIRSPADEEDIDNAMPMGDSAPSNYLLNFLSSTSAYVGVGGKGKQENGKVDTSASSDIKITPESTKAESKEGEGVHTDADYETEDGNANNDSDSDSDEESEVNEEEIAAADAAEMARQQKLLDDAQRAYENKGAIADEYDDMEHLLASLTMQENHEDLEKLYKQELERDKDLSSIHSSRFKSKRGSNAGTTAAAAAAAAAAAVAATVKGSNERTNGGFTKTETSRTGSDMGSFSSFISSLSSTRTPFQNSILENLDPHIIKEGVMLRINKDKNSTANDEAILDKKREKLYLQIADKLSKVFELRTDDYFYGNFNVWLVNDVLLQGHLYLTRDSILFFMFLPKRKNTKDGEDEIIQSGSLGMKSKKYGETVITTVLTHRYWAVLRPDTLSIYSSTTDLYFPTLVVDLKTCVRAEIEDKGNIVSNTMMGMTHKQTKNPSGHNTSGFSSPSSFSLHSNSASLNPNNNGHLHGTSSPRSISSKRSSNDLDLDANENELYNMASNEIEESGENITGGVWFKLVASKKTYRFHTDNLYSARQWVNSLTKIIFQKNNSNANNEVLFKIPFDKIVDFDRQTVFTNRANPSSPEESNEGATEDPPTTFSIKYLDSEALDDNALLKEKMKKKLKIKTTTKTEIVGPDGKKRKISVDEGSVVIDEIYFLFFRSGTEFFECFKKIMIENARRKEEAENAEGDDSDSLTSSKTDKLLDKAKKIVKKDSNSSDPSMVSTSSLKKQKKNDSGDRVISTLKSSDNKLFSTFKFAAQIRQSQDNQRARQEAAQNVQPVAINRFGNVHHFTTLDEQRGSHRSLFSELNNSDNLSPPASKMKKLGRTLAAPVKLLSGNENRNGFRSRSNTSPVASGAVSPVLERSHSEAHIHSLSTSPARHINFPRQLSLTGLKNLDMAFETSHKNFNVAESRYGKDEEFQDGDVSMQDTEDSYKEGYSYDDDDDDDIGITMGSSRSTRTMTESSFASSLTGGASNSIIMPTPLSLTDPPQDNECKKNKHSTLKSIGKGIKAISNATNNVLTAHPSHYLLMSQEQNKYYVYDKDLRETSLRNFHHHFSLKSTELLISTYYCHLRRAIPVYGKLYLGDEHLCFRSLLPGVATKMILPIIDIEDCTTEKSQKHSGLEVILKGYEELLFDFTSTRARNDCQFMILDVLKKRGKNLSELRHTSKHRDSSADKANNGKDEDTSSVYSGGSNSSSSTISSSGSANFALARIENARIKLFEDKLNSAAGLDVPIILEDSPFFKTEIRPATSFNFTLLTIGSRGDVQPYIALAKGLMAEGHNVTIATHKEFEEWILKHKIKFKEIAGNPTELMSLMVSHGSMSVAFIKEASSKFRGWIQELLTTSWEACQGTDILIEAPSAMAGVHIAEALGIPYFRTFTMPWTRTRAYPHAFIVPDQKKSGSYNYLTHVMFETVFWKGISTQVNKWRVEELGIPRTNLFKMQQSKIPFLYSISSTIFPPSVDFPDWVKVTGYWFLDEGQAKDYDPPKALTDFMESARKDGKKIVYIGFGSIVVNDAKSLSKAVIEAVLDADVRCILNKGWSDRLSKKEQKEKEHEKDDNDGSSGKEEEKEDQHKEEKEVKKEKEPEFPPEIYDSGNIPHDWLFPKLDACVHHGGSGTTGASLRAGIPTIIKPFFGDQFFYASRVEEIGVGLALRKLNAKSLSKCLKTATSDPKMVEKALKVSEKIKHENGVLNAVECIYSELEYAKNLSLSKQHDYYREYRSENQTPVVYEEDETEGREEEYADTYSDNNEDTVIQDEDEQCEENGTDSVSDMQVDGKNNGTLSEKSSVDVPKKTDTSKSELTNKGENEEEEDVAMIDPTWTS